MISNPILTSFSGNSKMIGSKNIFGSNSLIFTKYLAAHKVTNRALSSTIPKFNEIENQSAKKPKKPLSRVAIGGSTNSTQVIGKQTIEFSTWKAVLLLVLTGGVGTYFFKQEKKKIDLQRDTEQRRGIGKPLIGGPFHLIDTDGKSFTEKDLLGKFSLVYFGFTHCPDICPDELDKLGTMLNSLEKDNIIPQPLFVTCDPARDTPDVLTEYLSDFHPTIKGLTGEYDEIKNICKQYRVYFSTPPNVKPGQDYLVDHSIFFYLMDPEGQFVNVIGRDTDAKDGAAMVKDYVKSYIPKEEMERRQNSWFAFLWK